MKTTRALIMAGTVVAVVSCARILGIRPAERSAFEHRAHVTRGIGCPRCHAGMTAAGDEGPLHLPSDRACLDCHREPHDRRSCRGCHGLPETPEATTLARRHLRFSHAEHLEKLHGNCARCHEDVAHGDEGLRPSMATCLGCHEHREDFLPERCDRCHVDLPGERVLPRSHIVHDGDFRREHGVRAAAARELCQSCHTERQCAACHAGERTPLPPERLGFADPTRTRVHPGAFRARHAEEARSDPGLCTSCHAAEACADCHERQGVAAPREGSSAHHGPGWLGAPGQRNDHGPAARRDPSECASCHGGAGEALCVGCHRVGGIGGRPHPPGWRSNLDPIVHVSCRPCHARIE